MSPQDGPLPALKRFLVGYILKAPANWREALWRGVGLWLGAMVFSFGWVVVTRPNTIAEFVPGRMAARESQTRQQLQAHIDEFLFLHRPSHLAVVAHVSEVRLKLLWSNDQALAWPTSVDGLMSENMKSITGHFIFDGCWMGEFPDDAHSWVMCGFSASREQSGHVVAAWRDKSPAELRHLTDDLRTLAQKIRRLVF